MQNVTTLKILKDTFGKWNQKLVPTMSIGMFASVDRLCPKDVMEVMTDMEQVVF